MQRVLIVAGICLAMAACAGERPGGDPPISARLDSGVTSSNGGGQRVLEGTPNISTGTSGAVRQRSNNSQGAAY